MKSWEFVVDVDERGGSSDDASLRKERLGGGGGAGGVERRRSCIETTAQRRACIRHTRQSSKHQVHAIAIDTALASWTLRISIRRLIISSRCQPSPLTRPSHELLFIQRRLRLADQPLQRQQVAICPIACRQPYSLATLESRDPRVVQAHQPPAVRFHRLFRLPLVPCHGAREFHERPHRPAAQRTLHPCQD